MVVKKNCFCVFSILIVGKEAVCPDGLFVPAVFRESDFYLNSLNYSKKRSNKAMHNDQFSKSSAGISSGKEVNLVQDLLHALDLGLALSQVLELRQSLC